MKQNRLVRNAISAAVLGQTVALGGQVHAQEQGLEEVIVQARRVEESQQSVPVAVSALSGDMLRKLAVTSFEDMQKLVPSLQITADNTGGQSFKIRGSFAEQFTDPGVITYVDEAPIDPRALTYAFFDLASVQELKGPQGTLFGKNSTGGAVLFFTQKPSTEAQDGYVKLRAAEYSEVYTEGAYNVPLGDTFAIRAAGKWEERDGFIESVQDEDVEYADRDNWGLRLSALWTPTENIENQTQLSKFDVDQHSSPLQVEPDLIGVVGGLPAVLRPIAENGFPALGVPRGEPDAVDETFQNNPLPEQYEYEGVNNITTVELDVVGVKNILNYSKLEQFFGRSFGAFPELPPSYTLSFYDITIGNETDTWYDELQLYGKLFDDRFDWRVGGVYTESEAIEDFIPNIRSARNLNHTETESTSKALFAQVSYDLLDNLTFTVGGRQTWDERDQDKTDNVLNADGSLGACLLAGDPVPCELQKDGDYDDYNYNVSLDWQATEDMLLYMATRRGYKSGGFNTATPPELPQFSEYEPEIVEDVELGMKADWSLGEVQLRTNLALYHAEYEGILNSWTYRQPGTGRLFSLLSNVGGDGSKNEATMDGFELETTLVLTDWLQIGGFYGYIDSEYDNYVSPATRIDYSGEPVGKVVPKSWGATLLAEIPTPENWGDLSFVLNYTGADDAEITDTSDRTPSRDRTDLRLALDGVLGSGASVALYGKNVTDEENYRFIAPVSPGRFYEAPRQWGVEVSYQFGE